MAAEPTQSRFRGAVAVLAVMGGVLLIALIFVLRIAIYDTVTSEMIILDSGWEIDFNGEVYSDVKLGEFIFPRLCGRGDLIVLTDVLPENIDEAMSIRMLTYLSVVEVRVGGELRYSYGAGLLTAGKMVGSGFHYVPIYPDDGGRVIEIIIRPTEINVFSSISDIVLLPADERVTLFARSYMATFFISIFLIMLGFVSIIASLLAHFRHIRKIRLFYIGCFSLLVGLWSMCSDKLMSLFSTDMALNSAIEYMVLYLAVIPFVSLITDMRRDVAPWRRAVLQTVRIVSIAFCVTAFLLHVTDTLHFPAMLFSFHMLVAIELAALIAAAIKPLSKMDRADRLMNVGILVFAAAGGVDMVRFNLQKYLLATNHNLDVSVLPFGAFIFIVFLIMSYLVYLYDQLILQTEKRTLERLAYHDPLTGLYNRTRSEERFAELAETKARYIIVGIDLNGLKRTNDTLGHAQGDMLIQTYGAILRDAFEGIGEVYRMGGDEFIVIAENSDRESVDAALYRMEAADERASEEHRFEVAAAYGVAESGESGAANPEAAYRLADERMYEMKEKMKSTGSQSSGGER